MSAFRAKSWLLLILVSGLSYPSGAEAVVLTEAAEAGVRRENVVIVYDPQTHREEIFWELLLDRKSAPFGWLIPLPAEAEVEVLPFGLMGEFTRRYPLERPKAQTGKGYRHVDVRAGAGRRRRPPGAPHLVLPTAEIFPGAAVEAVEARLHRLDLTGSVPRGAGSVVLLHVSQAGAGRARIAVRLSFSTDRIVFPYQEPKDVGADARRLTAWVVSSSPIEMVARANDGVVVRPWRGRERHRATRSAVRAALGRHSGRLSGQGAVWIQTFEEQKADRAGYGVMVAVPDTWAGADGDAVVRALGGRASDPVFARVLAGRAALSELVLRDVPRRRVGVARVGGAQIAPAVVKRMESAFVGCAVAAKGRPVIEFTVSKVETRLRVMPTSRRALDGDDARCLSARAAGVSLDGDWWTGPLEVRLSRR